jgi:hypothetical protein
VRERTGCSVVAVERGDAVHVEFDGSFTIDPDDLVYICGTTETIAAYFREFPGASQTQRLPAETFPAWIADQSAEASSSVDGRASSVRSSGD